MEFYEQTLADLPDALLPYMGFVLAKASQQIIQLADETLQPFHIHSRHYGILSFIDQEGATSQVIIGQHLRIDRTTIVTYIDDLENLGMVERRKNPHDRRAYAVHLTEHGNKLLGEIGEAVIKTEHHFMAALTEQERTDFAKLLLKLVR